MYRVVVADVRSPRDGAFIEVIGHYNPLTEPETFAIDEEKALKWLRCGAKPTNTALRLLLKSGVMAKFKSTSKERSASVGIKKAKTKSTAEESPS